MCVVYVCAYLCVCIYVCMCVCICACVYICACMCVKLPSACQQGESGHHFLAEVLKARFSDGHYSE